MSFMDKFKENSAKITDKLSSLSDKVSLEKLNDKTRLKVLNEQFIPMLQSYDFDLTLEDVESFNFPLNKLMMPSSLVNGFNMGKPIFEEDKSVLRDNKILQELTPILRQIDTINIHYNGRPPSKYLRMDTYMSNEKMQELGLTNQQRNYYISILFNSKKTTSDVPYMLRPYIFTKKAEHKLVFKRAIPLSLKKQAEMFFLEFYMTNPNDYKSFQEFDNHVDDLDKELREEYNYLVNSLQDES